MIKAVRMAERRLAVLSSAEVVWIPGIKIDEERTFSSGMRAPLELNTVGALITLPDGVPAVAILGCYNGDLGKGEKVLQPLRAFGPPVVDRVAPMPYRQVQTLLDASTVPGRRNYVKTNMMQDIGDGAIDLMVERFVAVPSPLSSEFFQQLGNAAVELK